MWDFDLRYGDQITDLQNQYISFFTEKDEARKNMLKDKLKGQVTPHNMKLFNDRLAKTGSGFLAPSGLSWADLHLFNVLEYLGKLREPVFANFKHVKALDEKVRSNPNVSAYLAKRPESNL